ncbi:hypothetical protein HZA97_09045 [Candidatus Woesearchaeota archaeon]|nr:hypothetical protein [Candidatus Woesearchaeota archaeon]
MVNITNFMLKYLLYFLVSGSVISLAAFASEKGYPFLAGILMVLPNMSLVAFYFINKSAGPKSTIIAVKSSALATFMVWPFYALVLLYFIPKIGVNKSLLYGFFVSIVVAVVFFYVSQLSFFQNFINK